MDIRPAFRYCNNFPLALEAVARGKIDLSAVRPREFPSEESDAAFRYATERAQGVVKALIHVAR